VIIPEKKPATAYQKRYSPTRGLLEYPREFAAKVIMKETSAHKKPPINPPAMA